MCVPLRKTVGIKIGFAMHDWTDLIFSHDPVSEALSQVVQFTRRHSNGRIFELTLGGGVCDCLVEVTEKWAQKQWLSIEQIYIIKCLLQRQLIYFLRETKLDIYPHTSSCPDIYAVWGMFDICSDRIPKYSHKLEGYRFMYRHQNAYSVSQQTLKAKI